MKRLLFVLIVVLLTPMAQAQVKKHKKKNSTAAGTLYFYWGYNRSYYTHSDIRFVGTDYDFKLKDVVARYPGTKAEKEATKTLNTLK